MGLEIDQRGFFWCGSLGTTTMLLIMIVKELLDALACPAANQDKLFDWTRHDRIQKS